MLAPSAIEFFSHSLCRQYRLQRRASRKCEIYSAAFPPDHAYWHCDELRDRLKWHFPPLGKHECPVDLKQIDDLAVVPYIHKVMKVNYLLRNGRQYLPESSARL